MKYTEFLNTIRSELKLRTHPGTRILLRNIPQNNGPAREAVSILPRGRETSPSIYMDIYYQKYMEGMPLSEILNDIMNIYHIHLMDPPFDISVFDDFEKVRPNLAYKLIHYERNRSLLNRIPHQVFLDLALVCYFIVTDETLGIGNVLVYNEYLPLWNITEKELFDLAKENTPSLLPPVLRSMDDMIRELISSSEEEEPEAPAPQDPEVLLSGIRGSEEPSPLFVLSNRLWKNGASAMLYPGVLEEFSQKHGPDFYVIPSSIHEVILIPDQQGIRPSELNRMIRTINQTEVSSSEQLSDHAYRYCSKTGRLE